MGLVLAGGRSSRMGMDKAELVIQGESLLEHSVRCLKEAGAEQVLVSGEGYEGGIPDVFPGTGPLAGVHAALVATQQDLLVLPVDMPQMSPEILSALPSIGQETVVAHYAGFPLPLFVKYSAQVVEFLESTLSGDGDKAVRCLFRAFNCQMLNSDNTADFLNVNTSDQWATFNAQVKKKQRKS